MHARSTYSSGAQDAAMRALDVLVVEDDPSNRVLATTILSMEGHRVSAAENGRQVLDLVLGEGKRFDVILMDIQMPVMDGLEATRLLKADETAKTIPIVIVSGSSDRETAMNSGCDRVLHKPYRRAELLEAMYDVLESRSP